MHPCLYDKQEKEFKKEKLKQRAWQKKARQLNPENGKIVEQRWNNLKKCLLKRRMRLKEVDVSSAAAGSVVKAGKSLMELSWLFPFAKARSAKSNRSALREEREGGLCEGVNNLTKLKQWLIQ